MKLKKSPILAGVLMALILSLPVNAAEKTQESFQKVNSTNQIVTQSNYSPGYYQVTGTGVRFRSSAGLSGSVITVKPQIISGDFRRLYKVEIPVTVCG